MSTNNIHPLFQMILDAHKMGRAFESAHPTEFQKPTQEQLARVVEDEPTPPLSPEEKKRLAAVQDEILSEGRAHKNTRPQRHE